MSAWGISQLNGTSEIIDIMVNKFRYFFLVACTLFGLSAARGTTVVAPTFDELVIQAEVIFQGTVTDVRSEWAGAGAERHIVSFVTFRVEERFKGNVGATYSIRLLGGTVGGDTMVVTDAPKFTVGERDILFVENNGSQFVPLVGVSHGRFRVDREQVTGRDVVMTNERAPLSDVSQLGRNERAATSGRPVSIDEFKGAIRTKLANP
jgi:hypothetical protein